MSYKPVTAALRVLDVLAAVSSAPGKATVGEVHRLTGLDKATIVRMLTTLNHAGYIVRDTDELGYRTTGKTLQLSAGYDRHKTVSAIISEDLHAFRLTIGWPSDVALFDRDAMIVVDTSRQAEPMQFYRDAGYRAPMLQTSLGLSYLAFCPEAERKCFLEWAAENPAPQFALARRPELLARRLDEVRQQGYATMDESYSRENYDSQFFSLGVPLMKGTAIFGAINVMYLRSAMTPDDAREKVLAPLQQVATQIAAKLESSYHPKG